MHVIGPGTFFVYCKTNLGWHIVELIAEMDVLIGGMKTSWAPFLRFRTSNKNE